MTSLSSPPSPTTTSSSPPHSPTPSFGEDDPPPPPNYPAPLESDLTGLGFKKANEALRGAPPATLQLIQNLLRDLILALSRLDERAPLADAPAAPPQPPQQAPPPPDQTNLVVRLSEESAALKDKLAQAESANVVLLHELASALEKNQESSQVQKLRADVAQLQRALSEASSDEEPLKALAGQYVSRNAKLEAELDQARAATQVAQRECQRLASVSEAALAARLELETAVGVEKQEKERARAFQAELQSQVEQQLSRSAELEAQIDSLKVDLAKLAGSRAGLQQSLQSAKDATERERRLRERAEQAIAKAREETRVASDLQRNEARALKEQQARAAALEDQLTAARREQATALAKYEEAEKKAQDAAGRTGALSRQIQAQSQALAARDGELAAAQTKLEAAESELQAERKAHEQRREQVRAAAHDVATMTRENQALHATIESLRRERDAARAAQHEASGRAERLSGLLDQAKAERKDLLHVYTQSCDEVARLSSNLKDVAARKDAALDEALAERTAAASLAKRLQAADDLARKQRVDLENYDRRVSEMSRELKACRAEVKLLMDAKADSERKIDAVAGTAMSRSRDADHAQWELAQARGEIAGLSSRLKDLIEQNERLATELAEERASTGRMASIVERARTGQAVALLQAQQQTPAPRAPPQATQPSPTTSTVESASVNQRFQELGRVLGGGDDAASVASSAVKQSREERRQSNRFASPEI